uniref:UDP-glucose:glycoprotein glucosyltransferase 2-like n=1 Tax=Sinocyclocheilus anshuiensis TaxID=1608454 RepID=A0A671SUR7_9TELE
IMRVVFVVLVLLRVQHVHSASKGVVASLQAKWSMTPLLLETSEFIREDGEEKFWQFVNTVKELTVYKNGESVRSYYNLIIKKAGQFLTDLQVNLLKLSLSLRAYSPAVHAFQQIASDEPPPDGCTAFVVVHGQNACSTKDMKKLLKTAAGRPRPYLYKSDHQYPGVNGTDLPVAVLYAEIGTKEFNTFHKVLSERAQEGKLIYVLRHFVSEPKNEKMLLSGYGVELAIKSTEYKAVDDTQVKESKSLTTDNEDENDEVQGFLFGKLKKSHPELQEELRELRKHLLESTNDMTPLKVWELQDLSFQAASRIMTVPKFDSLKLMQDLSQNFPSRARLSESMGIQPGDVSLFINGIHVDLDIHNPFSILDILRTEAKILEGLHNLGIRGSSVSKFLHLPSSTTVEDSYALDIRHSSIMWANDIEKDCMYRHWPSSVQELLRATFPGVIRQIRRNFYNLVLFLDAIQEESIELVKLAELFYKHNIPLRIGFVLVVSADDKVDGFLDAGVALFRLLNYISEEYDEAQAFTSMIFNRVEVGETLSVDTVTAYLKKKFPKANAARILGVDSSYDDNRKAGGGFYRKSGLGALPVGLFNGIPLRSEEMDPKELEMVLLQKIMETTNFFQRAVFMVGYLFCVDVVDFLMEQTNVVPRINPLILSSERRYLDFTSSPVADDWDDTTMFSYLDSKDKTAVVSKKMKYFIRDGEGFIFYNVFIYVTGLLCSNCRVGVINNPSGKPTEDNSALYRAVWASLLTQSSKNMLDFTLKLLKEENVELLKQGTKIKHLLKQVSGGMDHDAFEKKFNMMEVDFLHSQQKYCKEVLKLKAGQSAVVSNGRVLSLLDEEEEFSVEDFHLLEKITLRTSAEKIKSKIKGKLKPVIALHRASDLIMKVDALLTVSPKGEARKDVKFLKDKHSVLQLAQREDEVFYDVVAIVDPLTRDAQKLAPLLVVLGQVVNMKVQVFMNCRAKLSEMPLKSFYRYVLEPDVSFFGNNSLSPGPVARFTEIPESPLLTLYMITPESWMVEAVRSPYDLDNIHLQEVSGIVNAEYELEYLLLEGHCFDLSTGQPPRGLQFTLGMRREPLMHDTIVMANLGYFQLKANPGAWILRLREGRSEDIYQIQAHDGTDSPVDAGDVIVVLNSFHSKIIKVRVQKKPDKLNEDLLSEGTESKVCVFWVSCSFAGGPSVDEDDKKKDVLNIFSVASGHLYERFLRIMMLSVLQHTKTPVKFWFLKNYLSPSFKDTISHMAKAYGFQYELVQYKWPRWLHQQTEKQRIIWGYKILFLDVLFPLAVDKIIFVDADQIVRADLKELRDLALEGAPYGYTPFCDSRKEMEGYRFWKTGYWASHLGHRKYHISALYVVDLKKFRKIAAGDRLRGQYQALSQDPNSLSNLDQVCAWKCFATTIDCFLCVDLLQCNNPKTKEPKLSAAVRIVPEWSKYDNEIKQFLKRVKEQNEKITEGRSSSSSSSPHC